MPNIASGFACAYRFAERKQLRIKNDTTKNLVFISIYFVKETVSECCYKGGLEDGFYSKRIHKYKLKDFKFTHLGENLLLHPYKSMYWEQQKILFLADLHLGKAAHFRKSGIPIPESIHQPDLDRFEYLVTLYKPERIIFLGDLFHSSINKAWMTFKQFCDAKIDVTPELVLGNHDILDFSMYDFLKLHIEDVEIGPFILSHKPLDETQLNGKYNLCGHIHPSIRVSGSARQSLRVECFYFGRNHGILPAYGNFTGTSKMPDRKKTDNIFAVTNQKIIHLF